MKDPKAIYIGKVLKRLRTNHKLSQEELAFRASLDRTSISLLERGLRTPTLDTIFKIASVYDMKGWKVVKEIEEYLAENIDQQDNL